MENKSNNWLEKPIHPALPAITNEIAIFAGIILLAIVTRFYDLETRVMSHDESLHTYFSWLLYRGQGYQHTPMMHGPFQFHLIALTYFLFGVSDFTARIPAVLFSIATVWMVWCYRGHLGKWGALTAGLLMVISPYMLYYGRYVRNESYAGFAGILLLYSALRYLENGDKKYLYFVTAATVLHFTAKETAFIYTAQILIFLGLYFIVRVTSRKWENNDSLYNIFIIMLALVVLVAGAGAGLGLINKHGASPLSSTETAAPADPATGIALPAAPTTASITTILFASAFTLLIAAFIVLIFGYGWANLLKERTFGLMILILTFVLPMLIAFPLKWLESRLNVIIPTDAASVSSLDTRAITIIAIFVAVFFIISIIVGMIWSRDWWKYAALFWGVFTILYTTVFTNAPGFFTGLIGSLGYWLVQQSVERGSQPEYYYILIQIPIYEFLTAIGSLAALGLGLKKLFGRNQSSIKDEAVEQETPPVESDAFDISESEKPNFAAFFSLMAFWVITSIIAFSVAGERMPWLTYHMAWPMVLLTGWGLGQLIEAAIEKMNSVEAPWLRSAVTLLTLTVFGVAAFNAIRSWYGANPPFQGTELAQLQATSAFLFPLITMALSGALLAYLTKDDLLSLGIVALFILCFFTLFASIINGATLLTYLSVPESSAGMTPEVVRFASALIAFIAGIVGINYLSRLPRSSALVNLAVLTAFGLLTVQTARTAFRANYLFYDDATEYLVYAHGATGIKDVMRQVEEISKRTAGGLNAIIAYDASAPDTGVSWPFVWYLRDYTALRSFDSPTRSLREAVAVIVDQKNFDKINPALGNEFYEFDYIRMWWPNQDYFNLDKTRVLNAITNPAIREGIFDIWFYRDYTQYAQATGSSSMTLTTWQPADQMKLYVRKDVASQIWNYGVGPTENIAVQDPYEGNTIILTAEEIFGSELYPPLGLNAPRSIARGQQADFYIADSRNHRILHIASDGSLLQEWGFFGDAVAGDAPIGTFNEPWGIAIGEDGSVYVSDTWNHRIQKFTRDGKPVKMWGQYGQPLPGAPETASSFWGPRGVAVDSNGRVLVADTGNKRIVVFDKDGNYITEFGSAGFDPGQFDEPVGVAIGPSGKVYVTDAWNQRIQVFAPSEDGMFYFPTLQWDVNGWFGQSLENKPLIAVGGNEHVFITDPEGYRILEFTSEGQFVRTWGDFGSGPEEIGLAAGVVVDQLGFVWVTDAGNNRILKYRLP